jgi:hypothetical protein
MKFWDGDPDAIPLDKLRGYARYRCKQRSQRSIAAEIGIGRTTLHKFVTGSTTPVPRVRHLLQVWYRAEGNVASPVTGTAGGSSAHNMD